MPTIRQRFLWPACNARRFYPPRPLLPLTARKPRKYNEWDPYVPPYDPYGLGASVSAYAGDEASDG